MQVLFAMLRELAYSNAWYGRKDAFAMLKELEHARFDSLYKSTSEEKSVILERLYAFIHIYASYTLAENNDLYRLSADMSEFINDIYDGSIVGVDVQIKSFKDLLAKDAGEETVSKFEELFS